MTFEHIKHKTLLLILKQVFGLIATPPKRTPIDSCTSCFVVAIGMRTIGVHSVPGETLRLHAYRNEASSPL